VPSALASAKASRSQVAALGAGVQPADRGAVTDGGEPASAAMRAEIPFVRLQEEGGGAPPTGAAWSSTARQPPRIAARKRSRSTAGV
jgi:hypothetical protein